MIRYILYFIILVLLACNAQPKQSFPNPNQKDINEIIDLVMATDSLFPLKSSRPLAIDLQRIRTLIPTENPFPEFKYYDINIKELIHQDYSQRMLFTDTDSAYLVFQSHLKDTFELDSSGLSNFTFTTLSQQTKIWNTKKGKAFIAVSFPLFSVDQSRAYITINDFCGMCGGGKAVFLKKIKGKWKITDVWDTWVS